MTFIFGLPVRADSGASIGAVGASGATFLLVSCMPSSRTFGPRRRFSTLAGDGCIAGSPTRSGGLGPLSLTLGRPVLAASGTVIGVIELARAGSLVEFGFAMRPVANFSLILGRPVLAASGAAIGEIKAFSGMGFSARPVASLTFSFGRPVRAASGADTGAIGVIVEA